jgi:energy-coupling factor transport system ATP-binding protein
MDPIIQIENLTYAYRGREDTPVLRGINLEVQQGEFLAIAGRTGSGKSTLCYAFNGLVPHSFGGRMEGTVRVCGLDTRASSIPALARKVGIVFQSAESQLVGLTVEEDVEFGLENIGLPAEEIKARALAALEVVRMSEYAHVSPWHLSGGQKQRVAIAAALAFRPEILVLDNPTAELDPLGKEEVLETIGRLNREHGITIIVVDQELHEIIPYAHRIAILDAGLIRLIGRPPEVLDQAAVVRDVGVKLPDVTEVGYQLRKVEKWPERLPVTVEEGYQMLRTILRSSKPLDPPPREPPELGSPILQMEDVSFRYPGGAEVLNGVDLEVRRGEFVALMGPNGAGKTTLAKHLNGLLKPSAGRVLVDALDSREHSVAELATKVGYVFQNPDHQIFLPTVAEELAFGPKNLGWPKERIERAVERALVDIGLEGQADAEPFFMGLAERKLIAIASVLIMEPQVLVLDEPATGADYGVALRIMRYISELHRKGLTVLIITHDASLAANYTSRLLVMREGRILLDGPPEAVFGERETLRACHVAPPQVAELAQRAEDLGVPPGIIRVDDMVGILKGA